MKILLVNKFHYLNGGSETYYFALAELLKERGHEVIFFSMKDERNISCKQEAYFVENVNYNTKMSIPQILKSSLKLLYSFEAKRKFEKLLTEEKPDIIHLNIFQSQLTGSIVDVACKKNIPIVYTAHDLKTVCPTYLMLNHGKTCEKCLNGKYFHCFSESCMKNSKMKSLLASLEAYVYKYRKTYKKLNYIITPSKFHKSKIEEAGITEAPIEHICNFLPVNTKYLPVEMPGQYFLYFGRLSVEKGILTLVKAYAKANINRPLYIVGKGPLEAELKELVRRLNLEAKIKLLGFKKGEELQNIIKKSYCVCLTSECYENAPYSVMEAMAAGKAVIVNNIGGVPELVVDGKTGYIAEPFSVDDLAEKIKKMDSNSIENVYEMGKCAQQIAKEKFSSVEYINKLEKIYIDLCNDK